MCASCSASTRRDHAKKALLVNSGAEAVENAVKIARYDTGRHAVITFDRGFHGRTLLTMTLTSKLVYKRGMGPSAPEVYRAPAPYPYGDITPRMRSTSWTGCSRPPSTQVGGGMILEPVQGEGGFTVMPPEFIRGLKARCEEHGILYIDDEVQAGMGRTGKLWGIEHSGVVPDLITVGKSLASGMPLAGVVGRADVIDAVHVGGWDRPMAATRGLCRRGREHQSDHRPGFPGPGRHLRRAHPARLNEMADRYRLHRRGARDRADGGDRAGRGPPEQGAGGGDRGSHCGRRAGRGLILLKTGIYDNVIRILVPVNASDEDLNAGLDRLEESLVAATGG